MLYYTMQTHLVGRPHALELFYSDAAPDSFALELSRVVSAFDLRLSAVPRGDAANSSTKVGPTSPIK